LTGIGGKIGRRKRDYERRRNREKRLQSRSKNRACHDL